MKLMFVSDIHGSEYYCQKMIDKYTEEKADRLVLLGDLLYHGPRNPLPRDYNPQGVIEILNKYKNEIYAVRGNCDSEVDQMVLEFPMMSDYTVIINENQFIYVTHGHIFNNDNLPPLKPNDILIHGHTHVPKAEWVNHYIWLNPGSISLPKEGNIPTYGIMEQGLFVIKGFEGEIVKELQY